MLDCRTPPKSIGGNNSSVQGKMKLHTIEIPDTLGKTVRVTQKDGESKTVKITFDLSKASVTDILDPAIAQMVVRAQNKHLRARVGLKDGDEVNFSAGELRGTRTATKADKLRAALSACTEEERQEAMEEYGLN